MPLAFAHPVAVLPMQRLGLPLSGLVVGSVAPDTPVFLPVGVGYATTHSGRGLAVTTALGLVLLLLWSSLLRDAVVDLMSFLRSRAPAQARLSRRAWLLAPLAVAVGAATHVLWDSATHDWGWVVGELPFLREVVGPAPLYRWFQHTSTVVGGAAVAAYCVGRLRARPVAPREPAVRHPGRWLAVVPAVGAVVGVASRDPETAVGAGIVALVAVAAAWQTVRRTSLRARSA